MTQANARRHRDPGATSSSYKLDPLEDRILLSPISFTVKGSYPVGQVPQHVAAADFNGDGKIDLAVTIPADDTVSILFNKGRARFAPGINYPTGSMPSQLVAGDFNGDGRIDLAVGSNGYTPDGSGFVGMFLNKGHGRFAPRIDHPAPSFGGMAAADFNNDGHLELAVLGNSVGILLNKGNGTFAPCVSYPAGDTLQQMAVGDFNGDHRIDVAVARGAFIGYSGLQSFGTIELLFNQGGGKLSVPITYNIGSAAWNIAAGDFNADHKLDFAVRAGNYDSDKVLVFLNKGNGHFRSPVAYTSPGGNTSIIAADFNGDKKVDILHDELQGIAVFLNKGAAGFAAPRQFSVGGLIGATTAADLNGDGKLDLAIVGGTNPERVMDVVTIMLNTGSSRTTGGRVLAVTTRRLRHEATPQRP